MTEQANPVDAAIKQAQEMAARAATAPAQDIVQVNGPTAAGAYVETKAPSLLGLTQGAMSVDGYVKVKEFGLLLLGKNNLVKKIKVAITPSEMAAFAGIRFKSGTSVAYLKSYDGRTCSTGGTWSEAVSKAQRADPTARPYEAADIPMRLLEDAKDADGVVVAEAGVTLGHSTSITNRANLAGFIKQAQEMEALDHELEVEIGYESKTNKNGQTWGLITFKILKDLSVEQAGE